MAASEDIDLDVLGEKLAEMGQPPLRFEPLFAKLKVLLVAESKRCFHEQRNPEGNPWPPLKQPRPPRKGQRKGRGSGDKALRDSGALMNSITAEQTGPLEMTWGSGLEYAAIHNWGGTIHKPERSRPPLDKDGNYVKPWVFKAPDGRTIFTRHIRAHDVTIPARTFVGLSRDMVDTITDMAGEFVLRALQRRGLRP